MTPGLSHNRLCLLRPLFRYWPLNCSPKHLAFLDEVQEIMEELVNVVLQQQAHDTTFDFEERLVKRVILSLQSPHFQVSTKAADLILPRQNEIEGTVWGTRLLMNAPVREMWFPLGFPVLYQLSRTHSHM